MPRQHLYLIASLVLILIGLTSFVYYVVTKPEPLDYTGTAAESALSSKLGEYTDEAGQAVSLLPLSSDYLVVMTWASWSPFTGPDIETLNRLAGEYLSTQVQFVAMNRAEPISQAKRALLNLPSLNDNLRLVYDTNDNFYRATGGYAMPETVIFNRSGDIIWHERRQLSYDDLKQALEQLVVRETLD